MTVGYEDGKVFPWNFYFYKNKNEFFQKHTEFFHWKTHKNSMKTMISTLKSLILINFVKKIRLAASPLPGVTSGGEHASGGPLRGG